MKEYDSAIRKMLEKISQQTWVTVTIEKADRSLLTRIYERGALTEFIDFLCLIAYMSTEMLWDEVVKNRLGTTAMDAVIRAVTKNPVRFQKAKGY